jgi:hypothetical protein
MGECASELSPDVPPCFSTAAHDSSVFQILSPVWSSAGVGSGFHRACGGRQDTWLLAAFEPTGPGWLTVAAGKGGQPAELPLSPRGSQALTLPQASTTVGIATHLLEVYSDAHGRGALATVVAVWGGALDGTQATCPHSGATIFSMAPLTASCSLW